MAANVGFFIWLIVRPFHAVGTTPTGLATFAAIAAVLYWLLDRYVSNVLRGAS